MSVFFEYIYVDDLGDSIKKGEIISKGTKFYYYKKSTGTWHEIVDKSKYNQNIFCIYTTPALINIGFKAKAYEEDIIWCSPTDEQYNFMNINFCRNEYDNK